MGTVKRENFTFLTITIPVFIDVKSGHPPEPGRSKGFPVCLKGKRARRAEIRSPPAWEGTSKGRNSRGARRNEARW